MTTLMLQIMLALFFEQMGHEVVVANHPYDVLKKATENQFDFFLLDIGLPDMDGYKLAKNLRDLIKERRVTFAAFTAYGDDSYKKKSFNLGFTHHFVRPGEIDEFIAAFERAIEELISH